MTRDLLLPFIALLLSLVAAIVDVRHRRIPNWLTFPGIVVGTMLRTILFGWIGLGSALEGCLIAGGVMLVFYIVRAMGAGDVKLMAAIGSFVGPRQALAVLLATGICGGVLGIVYVLYRRRMIATLSNLLSVLRFHAWAGLQSHPDFSLDNPTAMRLPYGLAIAMGMLFTFLTMWWR